VRGLTAARRRPEVEDDAARLTLGVKGGAMGGNGL
jgi:hypothetical protein